MESLERVKKETKDKNDENAFHLEEITELALVHCNIVNDEYQCDFEVSCTLVSNKLFGQLKLQKNFLTVLKNQGQLKLQQMHLQPLQKEKIGKRREQLII